jgi:WD40 repeat protein/serine/threonine protein kinase
MSAEDRSLDTLFCTAVEIPSAEERAAYLDQACGSDPDLRARVEKLVEAHFRAGDFMERPAAEPIASVDAPPAEGPGTLIGPYRLLRPIGEGGMGTVYVAEQQEPIRRLVAVKVIKPGLNSAEVLSRFEAERQALALLDHPNVAKVLDAGATDSGQPYFVMELIDGPPITEYCNQNRLSPRERLELFIPVCQAVQHAHQKGIIHRDLKPSNVLVARYDDRPVPKVIDFGVAKATAQKLTERTQVTGFGALVGTLEYMSPEQAELNQLDIDTRSDVYSLGVLLYELLTGETPFDRQRLKEAGLLEMLRQIREEEPPTPSARLGSSPELPALSEQRSTEPARLARLVRGELDWIVMQTLEKDRSRRYQTPAGLAEEIQRYLRDEPVQVGPPNPAYRLRKFLKRKRGPVLATVGILVTLVAGVIGTTFGLMDAWKGRAKWEEELLRREITHARQIGLARSAWERCDVVEAERLLDEVDPGFEQTWEQRHLRGLCQRVRRLDVLKTNPEAARLNPEAAQLYVGHRGRERGPVMAISGDGLLVAIAANDSSFKKSLPRVPDFDFWEVRVYELATGREKMTQVTPYADIFSLAFSPNGRRLLMDTGRGVEVIDAATGQEVLTLRGKGWDNLDTDHNVAFSPDGRHIAARSKDGEVTVCDATTGKEALSLQPANGKLVGPISSFAFSPDYSRIATRNGDKTVKVWDLATRSELFTLPGPLGDVSRESFSPDGLRLVLVADGTAKVFDLTGKFLNDEFNNSRVERMAYSSVGALVLRTEDGQVQVRAPGNGHRLLFHEDSGIEDVAFSSDGKCMACVSRRRGGRQRVRLWDRPNEDGGRAIEFTNESVVRVVFTGNTANIITTGPAGLIVWDGSSQEGLTLGGGAGNCVAISPDGRYVATGGNLNDVAVWDTLTGEQKGFRGGGPRSGPVKGVHFSPDSQRLVGDTKGDTVPVWDIQKHKEVFSIPDKACVGRAFLSLDGQRIVISSWDGTVSVWDASTGEELHRRKVSEVEAPRLLAISPDGKYAALPGLVFVDVETWSPKLTLRGDPRKAWFLSFSPDGQRIATGEEDGTVRVWDARTGEEQLSLKGHTGAVSSVAFSWDGQRIVSGGTGKRGPGGLPGGELKVWNAVTGLEKLSLKGHAGPVIGVAFSRDDQRIVSGSRDALIVWEAPANDHLPQVPK